MVDGCVGPVLLPVRRDTGGMGIFRMAHTVAWRCGCGVEAQTRGEGKCHRRRQVCHGPGVCAMVLSALAVRSGGRGSLVSLCLC